MITVTVTEIVNIAARSGDIGGRMTGVTVEDGKLAHKRVEDGRPAMAEVPLEFEYERGGIEYHVDGRADLIYTDGEYDTIEELKTVSGTFFGSNGSIPESHIAQGIIYAFMWCRGTGRRRAAVRITYVPRREGRERSFESLFSVEELEAEAMAIFARYERWRAFDEGRKSALPAEAGGLRFPYRGVREGQRDFMAAVMRTCRRGGRVMIQAPTGIGKTMASLYPAIKARGNGYADRIFYLTPKTSTRLAAEEAMAAVCASLPSLRSITLLSRERVCANGSGGELCSPETCERAAGHYDRVGEALWELASKIGQGRHITARDVAETAARRRVCPYELALDASEFCDVIVCDYNYVFDPRAYLQRFFGRDSGHKTEKYAFLCDEAHDLVDRARDMYSASISLSAVKKAEAASRDETAREALCKVADAITEAAGKCDELTEDANGKKRGFYSGGEPLSRLAEACGEAADACLRESFFLRRSDDADEKRAASAIANASRLMRDFACAAEIFDRRHTSTVEVSGGDIKCSQLCLDASAHLDERMRCASAVVMFSATMEPPDYFARVLGCSGCETLELPSPYKSRNLCLLVADKISTRMQDRAATAGDVADMIYAVAKAKTGNYICYLPSYAYLELIVGAFGERDGISTVVQKRGMSEREREEFLAGFTPDPKSTKVGFCVLGGVFSEGVDLPGDRLSGAIIVGVGMQQISAEANLLRDYYERICERGMEFAYVFPGMNKVLQAAGRVIRGERDRGVVMLIDDRFASAEYRALFPSHWRRLYCVGDKYAASRALCRFWLGEDGFE